MSYTDDRLREIRDTSDALLAAREVRPDLDRDLDSAKEATSFAQANVDENQKEQEELTARLDELTGRTPAPTRRLAARRA